MQLDWHIAILLFGWWQLEIRWGVSTVVEGATEGGSVLDVKARTWTMRVQRVAARVG